MTKQYIPTQPVTFTAYTNCGTTYDNIGKGGSYSRTKYDAHHVTTDKGWERLVRSYLRNSDFSHTYVVAHRFNDHAAEIVYRDAYGSYKYTLSRGGCMSSLADTSWTWAGF